MASIKQVRGNKRPCVLMKITVYSTENKFQSLQKVNVNKDSFEPTRYKSIETLLTPMFASLIKIKVK